MTFEVEFVTNDEGIFARSASEYIRLPFNGRHFLGRLSLLQGISATLVTVYAAR